MAFCSRCNRYFGSQNAFEQHRGNSGAHNICYDCNLDFSTSESLIDHYTDSNSHDYCAECDEHFEDGDELREHDEEVHNYCGICGKVGREWDGRKLESELIYV